MMYSAPKDNHARKPWKIQICRLSKSGFHYAQRQNPRKPNRADLPDQTSATVTRQPQHQTEGKKKRAS